MPKYYGINIFDYKGPQSLTHTVEDVVFPAKKILIFTADKIWCTFDWNFLVKSIQILKVTCWKIMYLI